MDWSKINKKPRSIKIFKFCEVELKFYAPTALRIAELQNAQKQSESINSMIDFIYEHDANDDKITGLENATLEDIQELISNILAPDFENLKKKMGKIKNSYKF